MIQFCNVCKGYGKQPVLDHITARWENGRIYGLLGVNGAGKSTLLRILAGVYAPDEGEVLMDGQTVFDNEWAKKQIFFLPDDPYYSHNVSAEELKRTYALFYPFDEAIFRRYLDFFGLDRKKPLRNFSKGMRRQAFIALALACHPQYLLLDEAFDGLDPLARKEFKRGLIDLQAEGGTAIIASHSLRELEDICDGFYLLGKGRVLDGGDVAKAIDSCCRMLAVFDLDVEEKDMPFPCLQFEKTGRRILFTAYGTQEELQKQLAPLSPVVLERLELDLEGLFIAEMQRKEAEK